MSTKKISVRDMSNQVLEALDERAMRSGRSRESEIRLILEMSVADDLPRQCDTCRFALKVDQENRECRRLPPQFTFTTFERGDGRMAPEPYQQYPVVAAGQWCGEHKFKGEV